MTTPNASRLLLLHVPGVDWRLAHPLVDSGRMPNLSALIENGSIGNLLSSEPCIGPSLAASLATGRRSDVHGVLGYHKPDRDSPIGIRPITSFDLGARPLWDIVSNAGRNAAAVGWPIAHPATVFDATVLSDAFAEAEGESFEDWELNNESVSDASIRDQLAELRMHPGEVTPDMVLPFIPCADEIDQQTDARLMLMMITLARVSTIHAGATWIAQHRPWDLLAVHLDLIERLSSVFLQYRSPRMPHVTETDHRIYGEVVDGAYQFFDMLLGTYLAIAGPQCNVILASSHGYLMDERRPLPPDSPFGSRVQKTHRRLGLLAVTGPNVRKDDLVFGASVRDVVPTALTMMELPVGNEMEGKVLSEVFEEPVDRLDPVEYDVPDYATELFVDTDWPLAMRRVSEHRKLGYYNIPLNDPQLAHEIATTDWLSNAARVCMAHREPTEAIDYLRELLKLRPDHRRALYRMAQCQLEVGDVAGCRESLDNLVAAGHADPMIEFLYGSLAVAVGNSRAAQEHFAKAESAEVDGVGGQRLLELLGSAQVSERQLESAERAFRKALEIDPDSTLANSGLGAVLLQMGHFLEAASHLRRALAKHYQQSYVHCNLGHCLFALGRLEEAAESYRQSLRIDPGLKIPQQSLEKTRIAMAQRSAAEAKQQLP